MRSAYLAAELTLCFLCAVVPDTEQPKSALKADAEVADLTGIYSVAGENGDESYGGACVVVKVGVGYMLTWCMVSKNDKGIGVGHQDGTGMRKGDTLSVAWGNGKQSGITVYKIAGKRLVGEWTQPSTFGRVNKETLIRVGGIDTGETQ